MKKEIGLLFILLLFSCANNFNKEAMIEDESYDIAGYEIEIEPENVTLEQLASKKLQAYFELLKLKTEHPEFREDILAQLKDFSKDEFARTYDFQNFYIENIRQKEGVTILSDSVQSIKLYFDIVLSNSVETDSVHALIATKTILLDGVKTKSTKLTFY